MRTTALLRAGFLAASTLLLRAQAPGDPKPEDRMPPTNTAPRASHGGKPDLTPPPEPPPPVEPDGSIRFDPNRLELHKEKGRTLLKAGDTLVKDFGGDTLAAKNALNVIRQQRLTDLVWIGTPVPTLEFFLTDNRAPRALLSSNLSTVTFQPDQLEVQFLTGDWWLAETRGDSKRPLLFFGKSRHDADRALAVIRQYHFNQIVYLERPPLPLVVLTTGARPDLFASKPSAAQKGAAKPTDKEAAPTANAPTQPTPAPGFESPRRSPITRPEPKPDPVTAFQRFAFNPGQVQLQHPASQWQLVIGRVTLKDFGARARDAREALNAVQFFHFTEQLRIEGEEDFEFYLTLGQAPRGHMVGQTGLPFVAKDLILRAGEDGNWWLYSEIRPLFKFHTKPHADLALEAIRRYQFDHLYRIPEGTSEPILTYFTRGF